MRGGTWHKTGSNTFCGIEIYVAIRQHPDHEEDEEAVGEADAEQPVHVEDHVEVHVEVHVEDHVEVHVEDHVEVHEEDYVKEHVDCGLRGGIKIKTVF